VSEVHDVVVGQLEFNGRPQLVHTLGSVAFVHAARLQLLQTGHVGAASLHALWHCRDVPCAVLLKRLESNIVC
jgi:hypothetical protein